MEYFNEKKKDLKNTTDDDFVKMAIEDFKKRENLCLAIRDKKSKAFMGEVVLYNFSYQNTVEIGFRLFKKYQNKGYAYESVKLVLDYVENVLNLTAAAKCYKGNFSSQKLLKKCNFELKNQDKKFYYFEIKKQVKS